MAKSLQRLNQIARPDSFADQKTAAEIASSETNSADYGEFNDAFLSQIKRIIHGSGTGNWHDDIESVFGADASLRALLTLRYQEVDCLSSDNVGDFVCIRGDRNAERWTVEKCNPQDVSKMPSVGVLLFKSTATLGIMQMSGPVIGVFTGLDYTRPIVYLDPSGMTYALPSPGPLGYVMVQPIGKPVASDIMLLSGNLTMYRKI